MHVLIRPRLSPYTSIVPAKLQHLRPSPSFTKTSIGEIVEKELAPLESKNTRYPSIKWACMFVGERANTKMKGGRKTVSEYVSE